jgi:hypothetical protein
MSKLLSRVVRAAFLVGLVAALGFGVRTALAAGQTLSCICTPGPGGDEFCVNCCEEPDSICGFGEGPRECLCA